MVCSEKRIVIYGLGRRFQLYEPLFRRLEGQVAYCDRDVEKLRGREHGISFAELQAHAGDYDEIVITLTDLMQAAAAMGDIGAESAQYRNIWQLFEEQGLDEMANRYYGEENIDAILESALLRTGKDPAAIRYLEIGTNHPTEGNNTYHFYQLGARGILVDPLPQSEYLASLWRSEDRFLRTAVSVHRGGTIDFYVDTAVSSGISSIHADHYERWGGKRPERMTVPCISVAELLEEAGFLPDVLLIDAEGEDENILRAVPFDAYPVPVICVEVCDMEWERYLRLVAYMKERGYALDTTTQRRVNSVFVREAGGAASSFLR